MGTGGKSFGPRLALAAATYLVVLVAAGTAQASDAEVTIAQDDELLIHRSTDDVDTALAKLKELGVDWVRVNATWSQIAPNSDEARKPDFEADDPGDYPSSSWIPVDRVMRLAEHHGLGVMLDVGFYAPRWAVSRLARPDPWTRYEINPQDFADFGVALARRYSGHYRSRGSGPALPAAVAFTLWNEPNHPSFMLPQWRRGRRGRWIPASPQRYRDMIRAAYAPMKRLVPAAPILIGNTSSTGAPRVRSHTSGIAPLRFLRELACVDRQLRPRRSGSCRRFQPLPGDGWAHHPYSGIRGPREPDPAPDNVPIADIDRLTDLLAELQERGRLARPMGVWIDEFGFQTNPPDPTISFGLGEQVRNLAEAELIAYRNPRVRSYAQFLLRDSPERRTEHSLEARWRGFQTGLEFIDGTPKPAELAFRYTLTVRQLADGMVRVWGHVRAGSGPFSIRIMSGEGKGRWVPATGFQAEMQTTDRGYFSAQGPPGPGPFYRVEVQRQDTGWEPGAAIAARP